MKRLYLKCLIFGILSLLCIKTKAYDCKVGGIYYDLNNTNNTASVTYFSGPNLNPTAYSGSVTIPSSVTYNGTTYSVTSIGDYAFGWCSGLTSVVIPSSVTSIGDYAFGWCSGLTSIVIPSSVTNIRYCAFEDCSGLTSVIIENGVTSIGECAFLGCSGLTSIEIPSSVTSIGNWTFMNCSGLTSIVVASGNSVYDSRNNCNAIIETASNTLITGCMNTIIPSGVTSIGDSAFSGCSGLTSVVIPSSVTSIGGSAFSGCSGLTSIVVESGNSVYDSRNNCNAIIETASNTLIAGCKNTKIPSSVTSIGSHAFYGCSGLTSIEIPSSVTSIGEAAFSDCSGLTSIVIPSSVTSIGYGTFLNCSGLTSLVIPSSVTSIGNSAFWDCSGLTSVAIPSSVISIENFAFIGCSGLTSITSYITDVFETGTDAFSGCNNATLYVPKGLVSTYQSTADWNRFSKIEEIPGIALAMSCNNKGKVTINGGYQFTNDLGEVSVYDGVDNAFVFQPEENCQLEQVLIDGLDVTLSVKNNQLTTKIHEGSKMIVTFSKSSGDVNGDGQVNISDVVALVNMILGQ